MGIKNSFFWTWRAGSGTRLGFFPREVSISWTGHWLWPNPDNEWTDQKHFQEFSFDSPCNCGGFFSRSLFFFFPFSLASPLASPLGASFAPSNVSSGTSVDEIYWHLPRQIYIPDWICTPRCVLFPLIFFLILLSDADSNLVCNLWSGGANDWRPTQKEGEVL